MPNTRKKGNFAFKFDLPYHLGVSWCYHIAKGILISDVWEKSCFWTYKNETKIKISKPGLLLAEILFRNLFQLSRVPSVKLHVVLHANRGELRVAGLRKSPLPLASDNWEKGTQESGEGMGQAAISGWKRW
jgi:hypothetical protein